MILNKNKLQKIKNSFDDDGYIYLKNIFNKNKIKSIKKNLFYFLDKKKNSLRKREIHYASNTKLINSVHHLKWPYIKIFRNNKKIIKIVKYLFQDKIKNFGAEVFAKPAKFGMPVPVHQDNYYWNVNNSKGLTVWIALDKCTKKNGALFYYKKSQNIGLLKHKASYAPGTSQVLKNKKILKNFKKITPELNIGDVLIHHCLIIHGSQKNQRNRDRAGLTMRYIGRSSKIDNSKKKEYEKVLKKQLT